MRLYFKQKIQDDDSNSIFLWPFKIRSRDNEVFQSRVYESRRNYANDFAARNEEIREKKMQE